MIVMEKAAVSADGDLLMKRTFSILELEVSEQDDLNAALSVDN